MTPAVGSCPECGSLSTVTTGRPGWLRCHGCGHEWDSDEHGARAV